MRGVRVAWDSPLLAKDTRASGRSWTTVAGVLTHICLLGAFAYVMFALVFTRPAQHGPVFATVAFQLGVVVAVAASLAAGAVASERERCTFDLLLLGRLRPSGIVGAKYVASMSWPALLVIAVVPVLLAVLLYDGAGMGPMLAVQLVTVAAAMAVGALALLLSARFRRTAAATTASYAGAVVLQLGTALLGLVAASRGSGAPLLVKPESAHPLLFANPLYALHALVTSGWGGGSHLGRLGQLLLARPGRPSTWGPVVQPWQLAVAGQLLLAGVFLWGATHSVASARRPGRPRRQPALGRT